MPTIAEIEADLLLASSTGNKPLFNSTLENILPEQLPLITVYSDVLFNLTELTDQNLAKSMTRSLMSTAGSFIEVDSIGSAMNAFSQDENYGALDALTDYLSPTQITEFGSNTYVGQTLLNITANDLPDSSDDLTIKGAIRNLFEKLGAQCDSASISSAMFTFVVNENYKALDAVTDYLTVEQKTEIGASPELFGTLTTLMPAFTPIADPDSVNSAVRNLMSKIGEFCDPFVIESVLSNAAINPDLLPSLDALTDYLTPEQLEIVGTFAGGNTISAIVNNFAFDLLDQASAVHAVRDLLRKFGDYIDGDSIGNNISGAATAITGAFDMIDALTDYLTEQQKIDIGHTAAGFNLPAMISYTQGLYSDEEIESGLRNYLHKLGAYIDPNYIGDAITQLPYDPITGAGILDALTDYLTPEQIIALGELGYSGQALSTIADYAYPDETEASITNVIKNYMQKLGAVVDSDNLGYAMGLIASNGAFQALDAVTDYLTVDQKIELGASGQADATLINIVMHHDPYITDDDALITAAVKDFIHKLGAYTGTEGIGFALETLSIGMATFTPALYEAIDSILDNLSAQQISDLDQTFHPYWTLFNLLSSDFGLPGDDNSPLADSVGHAVKVLGGGIQDYDYDIFMFMAVQNSNPEVLKAIVDNISEAKLAEFTANGWYFDDVLFDMPRHLDDPFTSTDDVIVSKALHNFMSKLGNNIQGWGLYDVITSITQGTYNYKALDAATDYLTQEQLEYTIPETGLYFNFAVQGVTQSIYNYGNDLFEGANAIRDLMHKIGHSFNLYDFYEDDVIGSAAEFSFLSDEHAAFGVDAVLGELPTEHLTSYILSELDNLNILTDAGITLGTTSGETMTGSDLVNDKFIALAGDDTLYGYDGDDQLFGDDGKDMLFGGLGNDLLHGGAGKDTIYGDEGDDIIFGGEGADTIYGGAGADTFWFDANDKGTGVDVIKDFSLLDEDKINISDLLEQYDPYTDVISDYVRLTESGTDTLLKVDLTGPGVPGGFATFAKLEGVTGLDLDDLINNGTIITA